MIRVFPGCSCCGPARFARPPRRLAASLAFTLIEILIVISILALVVATGVPAIFRAFKKDAIRQGVSDVVEACSLARAHAILGGASMDLVIVAEGGEIKVERSRGRRETDVRESLGTPQAVAMTAPRPAVSIPRMRLHEDVVVELLYVNLRDQMQEPEARVRFYPNGTCDEFALVLRHQEHVRKIELDIVTGLADVELVR